MKHICPKGYQSELTLLETQQAIKILKDCFQQQLSAALNLTRVSAPLFVRRDTGLNDDPLRRGAQGGLPTATTIPAWKYRWCSRWPSGSASPSASTATRPQRPLHGHERHPPR